MISLVTEKSRPDFISACVFDEIIGARMVTLLACYGLNCGFCALWLQRADDGGATAAISRFDGWLVISASGRADLEELAAFAAAVGEYRYIEAAPRVCAALRVSGAYDESHTMRYTGGAFGADYSVIDENPRLDEFYAVITEANPWIAKANHRFAMTTDWGGWYTHTSHLLRHGLGFVSLIREKSGPAAVGGVFTAGGRLAVISCIATREAFRGKGYAALITKQLSDKIIAQGKTPALFCASDRLSDYYASLGFSRSGKWGQLEAAHDSGS